MAPSGIIVENTLKYTKINAVRRFDDPTIIITSKHRTALIFVFLLTKSASANTNMTTQYFLESFYQQILKSVLW